MADDIVEGIYGVLPSGAQAERENMRVRQAQALRENLRKRKEQQRARAGSSADPKAGSAESSVPAGPRHIVDEEV